MSYKKWFENHAKKHKSIVEKLVQKGFTQEEIIAYFSYDNMVKNEIDFCPLYAQQKKCHDMEELNCYLCGCPNFRFSHKGFGVYDGHLIKSKCDIHNGTTIASRDAIHQDCSLCTVPHHKKYVQKHFDLDWKKIMSECEVE